ncbi:stress-response A/B barrel domain-containing protein UP3 [Vigna radiata var. radiata]|uniref:Stress-response A/B barrel domain-containing protein UP3 n=1 Tax=Vigna radiata var. radiata TaxID=3916 RepID=A0A1S3U305_VIGRR|nr:stress-response A/B barrel domain-containing protein UP3 [Vigna radiata var. radiata]
MMLSLQTRLPSFSLVFSPFKPYSPPFKSKPRFSTIRMSSGQSVVEHIVLVKVKGGTEPSKVSAMVNAMNSLASIDGVLNLTAGPLLRNGPTTAFTHMLHSRYHSKDHLQAYNVHPTHIAAVTGFIFPVCEDIMVVDWVGAKTILNPSATGSGLRVRFLKLKGGGGDDHDEIKVKDEVLSVVGGMKEGVGELSYGENFSPERAKGFSIASLSIFPGRKELESVNLEEGLEKVVEHVEDTIVVDYVVP